MRNTFYHCIIFKINVRNIICMVNINFYVSEEAKKIISSRQLKTIVC